jgi:cytidylate kinase
MYRTVTVAREFGSGGAAIGKLIADHLGWKLFDTALVIEVARAANVDPGSASKLDECVDSWLHRIARGGLWRGGFESVASVGRTDILDAECIAKLATNLIEESHKHGNCVIVGRGAQCVLQNQPDTFHVFIYAPWAMKVERIRKRMPEGTDVEELIQTTERMREEYLRHHFNVERHDPHLYDLMMSSALGEETVARTVIQAISARAAEEHTPK